MIKDTLNSELRTQNNRNRIDRANLKRIETTDNSDAEISNSVTTNLQKRKYHAPKDLLDQVQKNVTTTTKIELDINSKVGEAINESFPKFLKNTTISGIKKNVGLLI
jgi:hypothetical protein